MNGIKKLLVVALSFVMIFQLTLPAFAQTELEDSQVAEYGLSDTEETVLVDSPTTYGNWDSEKEFGEGWTSDGWRAIKGGQVPSDSITVESDYLNISKAITGGGTGYYSWIGSPAALSIPTGDFTIEATLKTAGTSVNLGNKFGVRFDTTKAIELYLGHGVDGFVSVHLRGVGEEGETFRLDTTVWHDYRLVVEADRSYTLYVDEEIAIEGLTAGTASTTGGNLIKFGAEGDQTCNFDIKTVKFANSKIEPAPVQRIKRVALEGEVAKNFGESFSPQVLVSTDIIDDGTEFVVSLYKLDGEKMTEVPDQTGTISNNSGTLAFGIPAGTPVGTYCLKVEIAGLEKLVHGISVLETIGDKPILPEFVIVDEIKAMGDYIYNPTNEFNFPSIVDTKDHPIADSLGRYYLFYAPHDAPAGLCLVTSDSLDGPWTEYGSNPLISKDWAPNYSVSHVSSPHVIWNSVYDCYFMYFHGENNVTRYATSDDLITWTYGGTCVYANEFSPTGSGMNEASYARVYEHTIPGIGNKYIMTLMLNGSYLATSGLYRHIYYAYSNDGIDWTAVTKPLLTPDNALAPDGIDYKTNLSGAFFMPWEGRFLVFAHASSGDIYAFEVGERLNLEKHWGVLFDDEYRAGAPCFMKDDEGRWHMFFEGGGRRLHANIIHAKEMKDDEKHGIRDVDLAFDKTAVSIGETVNATITAYDFFGTDISAGGEVSYIFNVDPESGGTFTADGFTALAPGEYLVWVEAIYKDTSVISEKVLIKVKGEIDLPNIQTGTSVLDNTMTSGATKPNLELPNVIKVGDKYHMYYNYSANGSINGIALATADSLAGPWIPHNNGTPIISGGGAAVVYSAATSEYYMYYNTSNASLHRAVSTDGISFTPMGEILKPSDFGSATVNNTYQVSAYPTSDGKYVMFVTVNPANKKAVGIAFSDDGITWQASTTALLQANSEDGGNIASPRMFEYKGKNFLTFHNSVGNLECAELDSDYNVVERHGVLYDSVSGEPDINRAADGFFLRDTDSSLHLFYTARSNKGTGAGASLIAYSGDATTHNFLFFDDFEGGAALEWEPLSGTWSVVNADGNDVYHQSDATGGANNYVGDLEWENYSFQAAVTPLNANSVITLSGRAVDNNNRYSVGFNKGKLAIAKKVGGIDSPLASKNYVASANTSYNIKIDFDKENIRLYINGVLELQATDASLKKGKVGIATYKSTANFDNVAVKNLDKALDPSAVSIKEPQNYQVVQRSLDSTGKPLPSLTGELSLNGNYGTDAYNVQVRVVNFLDGSQVVDWTDASVMLEGVFSAELVVPQGGWYRIEAKALDDQGDTLKTIVGTNKWGVGINVLAVGQSNMQGQGKAPYTVAHDLVANYNLSGSWTHLKDPYGGGGASLVPSLGNDLVAKLNIPVGFIPAADSGSGLHAPNIGHATGRYWLNRNDSNPADTSNIYGKSVARAKQAGGAELIIWNQGETDGRLAIEKEVYMADMNTLLGNFRTDLGLSEIPMFIAQIGNHAENLGDTSTDLAYTGIRTAQRDLDDGENFFLAATEMEFDRVDTAHYTTPALNEIGKRYANAICYYYGLSTYYRGAEITAASFSDDTKTVIHLSVNHRGGSDITPVDEAISGFYVYDSSISGEIPLDGAIAKRLDSNTIEIILASPVTGDGTVRYLFGFDPPRGNVAKDNTSLQLPLEATGDAIVVGDFDPTPTVDKSELTALYQSCSTLSNANGKFTEISWQAFEVARENASNVLADIGATILDVTTAIAKIENGIEKLVLRATPQEIGELENYVNSYLSIFDKSKYTTASWNVLVSEIDNGKTVLQNKVNATSPVVNSAINSILSAKDALVEIDTTQPAVNKDKLTAAVKDGELVLENASKYTEDSAESLKNKVGAGKTVLVDKGATQESVDSAAAAISEAVRALVLKPVGPTKPLVPTPPSYTLNTGGRSASPAANAPANSVAKSAGKGSGKIISGETGTTIKFTGATVLTKAALDGMLKDIKTPQVSIVADQLDPTGKKVEVRLTMNAKGLSKDVELGASINNATANKVKQLFNKWFSNQIAVVSLTQEKFETPTSVAIQADFKAEDASSLSFYLYNPQTNTFILSEASKVWVDTNGYLHFTTTSGGVIIVSKGRLEKK